jgi:hypothetical protein
MFAGIVLSWFSRHSPVELEAFLLDAVAANTTTSSTSITSLPRFVEPEDDWSIVDEWEIVGDLEEDTPQALPRWLYMSIGWSVAYYIAIFLCYGSFEFWLEPLAELAQQLQISNDMPVRWERRYCRLGDRHGTEVQLVKSLGRAYPGEWVAVKPDLSLVRVEMRQRATVASLPLANVQYAPMVPLPLVQQNAIIAQVEAAIAQGGIIPLMVRYGGHQLNVVPMMGRLLAFGSLAPMFAARTLRAALRSRSRFGALSFFIIMCYDALNKSGIFISIRESYRSLHAQYLSVVETATEASENAAYAKEQWDAFWAFSALFIDPWRMVIYGIGIIFLAWKLSQEEIISPTSSSASTPNSSAPASGATSPTMASPAGPNTWDVMAEVTQRLQSMESEAIKREKTLMTAVEQMRESMMEQDHRHQAGSMLEKGRGEADKMSLQKLFKRVEEFSSILTEEKSLLRTQIGTLKKNMEEEDPPPPPPAASPDKEASSPEMSPNMKDVIRKLELKTEMPAGIFREKLQLYREVDPVEWAQHFPHGYRTRIACPFVAEVLATGTRCEPWARSFLQLKGAMTSKAARELIPAMLALDQMIFVDGWADVVNSVAFERIARKALAIVKAWTKVEQLSDWSKPANAPKGWRSKVDYEEAKRVDPNLIDEGGIQIRDMEEEIRKEQEREASLLKARLRLEKHGATAEQ